MSSIEDILSQLDTEAMTREEIRAVMNQVGEDALLDSEMKRLGFGTLMKVQRWNHSCLNFRLNAELQDKLTELSQDLSGKEDAERRLAEEQAARIDASRQKQKDDRERREQERIARKEVWGKPKSKIFYFWVNPFHPG